MQRPSAFSSMVADTLCAAYSSRVNRHSTEASLVRELGTWGLAASIVNITVGGGIFRLPASAAAALGAAAPVAYLVCAVAMGLIVLCFAEAGSRVSLTGGLYAYVEVAFGPLVGFLAGRRGGGGTPRRARRCLIFLRRRADCAGSGAGGRPGARGEPRHRSR